MKADQPLPFRSFGAGFVLLRSIDSIIKRLALVLTTQIWHWSDFT